MTSHGSLRYRRIVVKAGTNVLTGGRGSLDLEVIGSLVGQLASVHSSGAEVALVTSGAVAAGSHALSQNSARSDIPFRQALAAVGQGRLMHTYEQLFEAQDITVAQALLSRRDMLDREGYLNVRNTLIALLDYKVIPIINENDVVAVDELEDLGFGDNDTLSAMVANLIDADLLIILSDIGGLYTADPHVEPDARLLRRVDVVDDSITAMAGPRRGDMSRGGMGAKLAAIRLAAASGVAVCLAGGRETDVVKRLANGDQVGTYFAPTASKMESRKRWMLSGLSTRGRIVVDAGAVEALRAHKRSLLPAGVREVEGDFRRGDIILVVDQDGERVACGVTGYSASDVKAIRGLRSSKIEEALGYRFSEEVLHRNNLAIL